MTESQTFFIDIINLVPDNSMCFIQAPSLENSNLLHILAASPFEYYKQIMLTASNKEALTKIIQTDNCQEYFQSVEIKFNDRLLFEGYDGMEYGTISKNLTLPEPFLKAHEKNEIYIIASDW